MGAVLGAGACVLDPHAQSIVSSATGQAAAPRFGLVNPDRLRARMVASSPFAPYLSGSSLAQSMQQTLEKTRRLTSCTGGCTRSVIGFGLRFRRGLYHQNEKLNDSIQDQSWDLQNDEVGSPRSVPQLSIWSRTMPRSFCRHAISAWRCADTATRLEIACSSRSSSLVKYARILLCMTRGYPLDCDPNLAFQAVGAVLHQCLLSG